MFCCAADGLAADFCAAGLAFGALAAGDGEVDLGCCGFAEVDLLACGFSVLGRVVSLAAGLAAGFASFGFAAAGLDLEACAGFVGVGLRAGACLAWFLDSPSLAGRSWGLPFGSVDCAPVVDSVLADFWGAESFLVGVWGALVEPALGCTG